MGLLIGDLLPMGSPVVSTIGLYLVRIAHEYESFFLTKYLSGLDLWARVCTDPGLAALRTGRQISIAGDYLSIKG